MHGTGIMLPALVARRGAAETHGRAGSDSSIGWWPAGVPATGHLSSVLPLMRIQVRNWSAQVMRMCIHVWARCAGLLDRPKYGFGFACEK